VLAESAQTFVEAAEALGRGRLGILFRHILPNVISPIVIQTAVCLSYGVPDAGPVGLAVPPLRDALDPRAEMR
jgi:peptide/nickel transport system permease protein